MQDETKQALTLWKSLKLTRQFTTDLEIKREELITSLLRKYNDSPAEIGYFAGQIKAISDILITTKERCS